MVSWEYPTKPREASGLDPEAVHALLLFGLGALGAGRVLGVDGYLERATDLIERYPALRYLTG